MSNQNKKRLKNTTEKNSQKGVTENWQPTRCLTPFLEIHSENKKKVVNKKVSK